MTPAQCADAVAVTEQVQREVWWLNRCCARRLAYALRPLLQARWTAPALAAELSTWPVPARLGDPVGYVHHELARRVRLGHLTAYGIVPPSLPDDRVDDSGRRYARMLNDRHQEYGPAWRNYQDHLRAALRRSISTPHQAATVAPPRHVPQLREKDGDFLRSLTPAVPDSSTVRDVYRARAYRHDAHPPAFRALPEDGWLEQMRDEYEARRACADLRAALDARLQQIPSF